MAARRRFRWIFLVLGLVAVGLVLFVLFHKKKAPKPPPPAVPVTVAQATAQDIPVSISALGAAQAWRSDTIVAQVSGLILRTPFKEGDRVRAGQVLAEIDPSPYRAALLQAQGALQRDQALLAEAKMDLARYQVLAAQNSIARQTYEDQQAVVNQDEGVALLDQGAVAAAKVNVSRCTITAPISGRVGVRLVDPGNLVGSGAASTSTNGSGATNSTASGATAGAASGAAGTAGSVTGGVTGSSGIVVVNEISPIAVTFTVPQYDFQRLMQLSDGFRKPLTTRAYSQENNTLLGTGELQIADNKVDPSTGTIQLKARFSNADEKLWPGQYVNVVLTLQTLQHATTVPAVAVNQGPNGPYLFVVVGGKAQLRQVKVQSTQGPAAIIASGVRPGETVVTDGEMILKNGSPVRVVPGQAPAALSANPST
ncbi:MAG TPA: efflux RND transporter periplasmic adaptor subunit [Caulobacteraceae bacterium]|jgi:multidrug efflux system membrane fusion protein|nr:efflux RND transporter periplasmic adaptor subunit [Caulobacteraceae bacterium]